MTPKLGPFSLLEPAGTGGMGQVWRAIHASGLQVAVKALTAEWTRQPKFLAAFQHEVRAVARLDHPNVIPVYDHGIVGPDLPIPEGSPYLVMAWADGSLHDRPPRSWPEILSALLALLDGVGHAHASGVLHRDLKPANVLRVGSTWTLADFGIARMSGSTGAIGAGAGTPLYMAPEQIRGAGHAQGPWTDLYALGCVAWELVSGSPPYHGDHHAVMQAHLDGRLPPLQPVCDVPSDLSDWLAGMLAVDPHGRFGFAADARAALLELSPTRIHGSGGTIAVSSARSRATAAETPAATLAWLTDDITEDGLLAAESVAPYEILPRAPLTDDWRPDPPPAPALPSNVGLGLLGLRPVPFVGRESERDALWAAVVDVARTGRPRAAVISGASGSGKSRLAGWLCERAHQRAIAGWLSAAIDPEGTRDAVADAILAATPSDGTEDAIELVALTRGRLTPVGERNLLLVRRLSTIVTRPLVLVLDDVHHKDADVALAREVLQHDDLPILVVLTVDSATPARGLARLPADRTTSIELGPLSSDEHRELVRGVLPLDPSVAAVLVQKTGGNPGLTTTIIRTWAARSRFVPGPLGFRLDGQTAMPEEALELWRDRLEAALQGHDRRAVEVAAALGVSVDAVEWRAVCLRAGIEPDIHGIERLLSAGLMRSRGLDGWTFTPSILRDCLDVPKDVHFAAAAHLTETDGHPERIGRHRRASGHPAEAVTALVEASRRRRRIGELELGLSLCTEAEEALVEGDVPESDPRWGDVLVQRADGLRLRGESAQAIELIERTISLADRYGWKRTRAHLSSNLAEIYRTRGRLHEAIPEAERAVAMAREVGDPVLLAMTLGVLGNAWRAVHEPEKALALFEEGWRLSSRIAEPHSRAQSELLVAFPHMDLHQWDEADRYATLGGKTAKEHGIRFLYGAALAVRARVARERDDLVLAERLYRESSQVHLRCGHALAPLVELNLAMLLVRQDRHDEARGILARWRNAPSARGMTMTAVLLTTLDAWLAAVDGQWDVVDQMIEATERTCTDAEFSEVDVGRAFVTIADLARDAGQARIAVRGWTFAERQFRLAREEKEADHAAARTAGLAGR